MEKSDLIGTFSICVAIEKNAEIPTGIREVTSAAKADKVRKVIVNGRLVIETANGTFSATGARIK